jgi:AcrR family transcriptional regulator
MSEPVNRSGPPVPPPPPPAGSSTRTPRRPRAQATRRRIRDAARRLFVERGYVATTIEAIAGEAGVAVPTVYLAFGTKRALLAELLDIAAVGDEEPVAVLERPWVDELRHDPDPQGQLRRWVRGSRDIAARVAPLWEVARNAAPADPDIAAQVHRYKTLTLQAHRYFVTVLAASGGLRDGLDPQRAADIVFGLLSHELYRLLVIEQGWAPEDWEQWVADTLAAQLLPAH